MVMVVMATAIMVDVAMMTVVMVQVVAAAEHKTNRKRYDKQFQKVHIHDIRNRRLCLYMNQAHRLLSFI